LVAGVAGGLAERFDVNEYLVRVIFAALTLFWGLGVAIYLVMWVVVPAAPLNGTQVTEHERAPVSTSHRLSTAVVAGVIVLAILALLVVHPFQVIGPSLALAWIVFLAVLAVIAIRTPARRMTFRRVAGVIFLAWLSVMILFVGGALAFLASTGVSMSGGIGNHVWQPTTLSQVQHSYRTEFGAATVDLRAVTFPTSGFTLSTSVAAGELTIVVPADAVVNLTTNVGAGNVNTFGYTPSTTAYSSLPAGKTGAQIAASPHVTIDARVGAGRILLSRAVGPR
jgi:phage shock protein PspC (stress-responsive transcriptional regulator)/predicted membrane protein